MIVYRICRAKYADDLNGTGAKIAGGRWNSKGVALLYTSDSRALAMAEVAVHLPYAIVPDDFVVISIELPENCSIEEAIANDLPHDWDDFPINNFTRFVGDDFVRKMECLVLKVPSAVVKGDFNYLINPFHKDFHKVKVVSKEPFIFDGRLFKR